MYHCSDIFSVLPSSPDEQTLLMFNDSIVDLPNTQYMMGMVEDKDKEQSKGKQAQDPNKEDLADGSNLDNSKMMFALKKRSREQRCRRRINEKLRSLQQMLPNSEKGSKASILSGAIKHIHSLKLQLEMMSQQSLQSWLQATTCLPQTHTSTMSTAYGIDTTGQLQMHPFSYGMMVPPRSVQIASIPQPNHILCPPHYFPTPELSGLFAHPFNHTQHQW